MPRCNLLQYNPLIQRMPARSRDGVVLKRGLMVYCIYTRDGGQSWQVTGPRLVRHTNHQGMVCFEEIPILWQAGGDNRIFSSKELAEIEASRRNQ
jgi:hypothetical protein